MALRASGRIGAQADLNAGPNNGGVTSANPLQSAGGLLNTQDPVFWTWVIFGAGVAYLLGAYVMLGRYRIPL